MCWHISGKTSKTLIILGTRAMSKRERDCFSATLFNRGLISLPGWSQREDNLHSTCPPICALGTFLYTIFPWRGKVSLVVDPTLQDILVLVLPYGSFGGQGIFVGLICRGILWSACYNVNFQTELNDILKIREGPCILRSLCVLLFIFHHNTSKCLGKKQKNYKSH